MQSCKPGHYQRNQMLQYVWCKQEDRLIAFERNQVSLGPTQVKFRLTHFKFDPNINDVRLNLVTINKFLDKNSTPGCHPCLFGVVAVIGSFIYHATSIAWRLTTRQAGVWIDKSCRSTMKLRLFILDTISIWVTNKKGSTQNKVVESERGNLKACEDKRVHRQSKWKCDKNSHEVWDQMLSCIK